MDILCLNASQRKRTSREEARHLGHNFVGTEQLLLGLEKTGVAAKVLKSMGVNLKDVRIEVEKSLAGFGSSAVKFGQGAGETIPRSTPAGA